MAACAACGRTTTPDLYLHHRPGCREAARWPADRIQPELSKEGDGHE